MTKSKTPAAANQNVTVNPNKNIVQHLEEGDRATKIVSYDELLQLTVRFASEAGDLTDAYREIPDFDRMEFGFDPHYFDAIEALRKKAFENTYMRADDYFEKVSLPSEIAALKDVPYCSGLSAAFFIVASDDEEFQHSSVPATLAAFDECVDYAPMVDKGVLRIVEEEEHDSVLDAFDQISERYAPSLEAARVRAETPKGKPAGTRRVAPA